MPQIHTTHPDQRSPRILYEDSHILVCAKPHGLAVQNRRAGSPDREAPHWSQNRALWALSLPQLGHSWSLISALTSGASGEAGGAQLFPSACKSSNLHFPSFW